MWFASLVGFPEENPDQVRNNLELDGTTLRSLANGRELNCGRLEIPSLAELRQEVADLSLDEKPNSVREWVGDVRALHADPEHAGTLFQVASQFNLLEMMHPSVPPERGIDIYERDRTQGPACAMCCGGATIYRNYFVSVGDRIGQTADNQIDCITELGIALGNTDNKYWKTENGYALPSAEGLAAISNQLSNASEDELESLRGLLRIGVQWDAGVTLDGAQHTVSQAFCSALPVAYSTEHAPLWEPFARLVLEAAYEASLACAAMNAARARGTSNRVFLTQLGGGAFGNEPVWIIDAITRAVRRCTNAGLDIVIVSYGQSLECIQELITEL